MQGLESQTPNLMHRCLPTVRWNCRFIQCVQTKQDHENVQSTKLKINGTEPRSLIHTDSRSTQPFTTTKSRQLKSQPKPSTSTTRPSRKPYWPNWENKDGEIARTIKLIPTIRVPNSTDHSRHVFLLTIHITSKRTQGFNRDCLYLCRLPTTRHTGSKLFHETRRSTEQPPT